MKYETQLFGGQTNLHCMKQILHNAKSNSHGCIRLAICIATAFAVVMLTACSDGNGTKSFHSSDEAINYRFAGSVLSIFVYEHTRCCHPDEISWKSHLLYSNPLVPCGTW